MHFLHIATYGRPETVSWINGDKWMFFENVLIIKNGKNQGAVENPEGRYPIYGSGGVMGRADEYICQADTVIIGRKGNINSRVDRARSPAGG